MAQAAAIGCENVERFGGAWQRAHQELLTLAAKRAGLDFVEGRWLLQALRTGVHTELGYGSVNEYVERLFGYSARLTQEKLRVAEALEGLPETARELESARLSFSAVRELTRVAIPSTERAWLAAARGRTVREVETLVSGHRPGSRPGDAADSSVKRHVLRLEVSGETLATFREAMAEIRRAAGEALDDDAAVLQLCRGVLGGARDEGRSSYQVVLTVCERCGAGKQQGRGELVAVAAEVVEMAECDAQHVGCVERSGHGDGAHVGEPRGDARDAQHVGYVEPSGNGDGTHVGEPRGDARAGQHVGYVEPSGNGDGAHVGSAEIASRVRATQTIPPALRRQVLRRDGGRCQLPGCRHATFVDVHHLRLRSEGGTNALENLVTLCGAHHRAIHRGRLLSTGTPSGGLTFRHADGTVYGGTPVPANVELRARTYRALVRMGFRELEAKQALARIEPDPLRSGGAALEFVGFEALLRAALRELGPNRH